MICFRPKTSISACFLSLLLYVCSGNWNTPGNGCARRIFIRCHLALNQCGLWCSLISACSTCSIWAPCAGLAPQRRLKEPLHLCQGQVEIRCILLIGQSAFQTRSRCTQIRLSYKPGVNRSFWPWQLLIISFDLAFFLKKKSSTPLWPRHNLVQGEMEMITSAITDGARLVSEPLKALCEVWSPSRGHL